ncbi:hypothetical protein GOP47_0006567 [Adiantum capillus-veneris]|uniref:superoxide dismutase n=1 Tax=Adiantum capillus-veneris TaxID=13818 RepID=A0A9D4ZML6_ADICA|nr:hypothetical protein GOP47_0006567 [Adiantum capillus-veneris]
MDGKQECEQKMKQAYSEQEHRRDILDRFLDMAASMTRSCGRKLGSALRMCTPRGMQMRGFQTYSLPELSYDYGALEPYISGEIMELHHSKHHKTYITNFNTALEKLHDAKDPQSIVSLQSALNFNGGGHINHTIFWKNLAPKSLGGGEGPQGPLASAISTQYGSLEKLIAKMNSVGAAVQGSGWVWLGLNKELKHLLVETTANQDPLVNKGLVPLLGIDVWEHAYYLQYKNVRPDYLKNIWNVVNWKDVSQRVVWCLVMLASRSTSSLSSTLIGAKGISGVIIVIIVIFPR